jgi:hypothetical protein
MFLIFLVHSIKGSRKAVKALQPYSKKNPNHIWSEFPKENGAATELP